ncbi:hypothetical protein AMS68_004330 [Peltaster fructicola]|uniref:U2 small nuclear ribonucleoprotein A' n=1 Tax=Peltaster fructicola TaxID=286661 RepID=A0A6H0XVN6_9PEZI|nr:hypothetical protein AMS68_004330 [Peltaster fructicola]
MLLTTELIANSLSYTNPLKERELDLRGHKIPAVENLGSARDHESIDFTDNDIDTLGNFPLSPRLHTLLCSRNRIRSIQSNLAKSLPNVTTLVLAQNNISELAELESLRDFARLTHVSLVDNPVTGRENYRYWILHLAPQIRFLDFQKVKDVERKRATELFGTAKEPNEQARSILASRSKNAGSFAPRLNGSAKQSQLKLTDQEKKSIETLIRSAKTLAEVQQLEKCLNEGRLPPGVSLDAMDHT